MAAHDRGAMDPSDMDSSKKTAVALYAGRTLADTDAHINTIHGGFDMSGITRFTPIDIKPPLGQLEVFHNPARSLQEAQRKPHDLKRMGSPFDLGGEHDPIPFRKLDVLYRELDRNGTLDVLKQQALREAARKDLAKTFSVSPQAIPTPPAPPAVKLTTHVDVHTSRVLPVLKIPVEGRWQVSSSVGDQSVNQDVYLWGYRNIYMTPAVGDALHKRIDNYVKAYRATQGSPAAAD